MGAVGSIDQFYVSNRLRDITSKNVSNLIARCSFPVFFSFFRYMAQHYLSTQGLCLTSFLVLQRDIEAQSLSYSEI